MIREAHLLQAVSPAKNFETHNIMCGFAMVNPLTNLKIADVRINAYLV